MRGGCICRLKRNWSSLKYVTALGLEKSCRQNFEHNSLPVTVSILPADNAATYSETVNDPRPQMIPNWIANDPGENRGMEFNVCKVIKTIK